MPPSNAPTQDRVTINLRRSYIVRQLRSRGILSYSRYNHKWNNPSSSTLKDDLKALNQLGFEIDTVEASGRRYMVDTTARHLFTKAHRSDLNAESKAAIGMVAASLILGIPAEITPQEHACWKEFQETGVVKFPSAIPEAEIASASAPDDLRRTLLTKWSERVKLEEQNPELSHCWSKDRIAVALANGQEKAALHADLLLQKLRNCWAEESMNVYIDAGTTNDRMVSILQDLLVPTVFSKLRSLAVCTNSPSIFATLREPEICIRTVIVGGDQVIPSEAIAGRYSEAFFRATSDSLRFSAAFIGATCLDLRRGEILSDSEQEKQLKTLAFEKSNIRVVCIDSTKVSQEPIRAGFCFARLDPSQVDLIIINRSSTESRLSSVTEGLSSDDIAKCIRDFRVPVLQADFPSRQSESSKELSRGAEIRFRVPHAVVEDIISQLPWFEEKQVNKCMELFLNAMAVKFLEDAKSKDPGQRKEADSIVQKFIEFAKASNLHASLTE